jgi:hypothetical protein
MTSLDLLFVPPEKKDSCSDTLLFVFFPFFRFWYLQRKKLKQSYHLR